MSDDLENMTPEQLEREYLKTKLKALQKFDQLMALLTPDQIESPEFMAALMCLRDPTKRPKRLGAKTWYYLLLLACMGWCQATAIKMGEPMKMRCQIGQKIDVRLRYMLDPSEPEATVEVVEMRANRVTKVQILTGSLAGIVVPWRQVRRPEPVKPYRGA